MRPILLLVVCILCCSSCAPTLKVEQHLGDRQLQDLELPRQVAILPFANRTDEPGIDALVRRTFANHFAAKNFQELKLPAVDEKLVQFEKATGKKQSEAGAGELAAALGCDGLLFGSVTSYQRFYAALYSQFGVEAEVWMVNAKTGKEVFRLKEEVRYHEGGIPTSPLSALVTVVSTAMNLREIQKVRLVNELSYKLTGKMPEPKSFAAEGRPAIKEVLTNAAEGPFGVRKAIRVGLEGEPGLVATFDIGNFRKGVPMREVAPGIYAGEYAVLPGDAARDMPIVATLTRPGGGESQWFDGSAYVAIDTVPPPPVTGVKARGLADRVRLVWPRSKVVGDLKGYRVLGSDQPLTGYRELAQVEHPSYDDLAPRDGAPRYYRVLALDLAGNESDPVEGLAAAPASAEPPVLTGDLANDLQLAGEYLVRQQVTVPRGVTLALLPGARLRFEKGAGLTVAGRLSAMGDDTETVEFLPAGEGRWQGISVQDGTLDLAHARVVGAETALALKGTRGSISETQLLDCGTALAVTGVSGLNVSRCTISGHDLAVSLHGTDAAFIGNTVIRNKTGVSLDSFAGELRDNNIFGNETNLTASAASQIGVNFFGTLELDQMRVLGVAPAEVYDARFPGGKVAAAVANPYRNLSPEERQKRGTEVLIEAGRYFRQRNFGKAATLFAQNLQLDPSAETYYYLGLCHQEMKEPQRTLAYLEEGTSKFPNDALLWRALGMLAYEGGDAATARKALEETLRLSPDDRQARFILERVAPAPAQ